MKKVFMILSVIAILTSTFLVHADSIGAVGKSDNAEYQFVGIDGAKTQQILDKLNGTMSAAYAPAFNLLCLFGHDIKTGMVIQVTHNVYTSAPRCEEKHTYVEYCARDGCDYFKVTGESKVRIGCH